MTDYSLFGAVAPGAVAVDGAGGLNLGLVVVPSVDVEFAAWRWYGYRTEGAFVSPTWDVIGTLWDAAGVQLAYVPFTRGRQADPSGFGDAWRNHWIHPRIKLLAGQQYVVGVWVDVGRYGYTPGAFAADYVSGPLTVPAPGGVPTSGLYDYNASINRPTNGHSGVAYGVDLVVKA